MLALTPDSKKCDEPKAQSEISPSLHRIGPCPLLCNTSDDVEMQSDNIVFGCAVAVMHQLILLS